MTNILDDQVEPRGWAWQDPHFKEEHQWEDNINATTAALNATLNMSDSFGYNSTSMFDNVTANASAVSGPLNITNSSMAANSSTILTVPPTAAMDPYSYYYEDGHATSQEYLTAAVPVAVAFLSLVGSYIVMRESYADYRVFTGASKTRKRGGDNSGSVALALQSFFTATFYFIYSFTLLWGPLAAPSEIPFDWAMGNTATCSVQGFFAQFGAVSSSSAHSVLVWMYVMLIKFSWPEARLLRWLPIATGVSIALALVLAIYPAAIGYYNYNSETKCWVGSFPYQCDSKDDLECIRGANATQMQMLLFIFPHWFCVMGSIFALIQIWCAVRCLEYRLGQHAAKASVLSSDGMETRDVEVSVCHARSKAVATQGALLSFSYLLFIGVASVEVIFKVVTGWSPYWLAHISNAFIAIPGVMFNLVFCHPRGGNVMKTPEGRWVRRYVMNCFYNGWDRVLGFFVPEKTRRRVSVTSSTLRCQIDIQSSDQVLASRSMTEHTTERPPEEDLHVSDEEKAEVPNPL